VEPRLNLRLRSSIKAPQQARRAVSGLLASVAREDLGPDAALLVSELVTNAVVHAGGPIGVSAAYRGRTLRVEVHDTGAGGLSLRYPSAHDEAGRGFRLVTVLARRWAVDPAREGKTVWFEIG